MNFERAPARLRYDLLSTSSPISCPEADNLAAGMRLRPESAYTEVRERNYDDGTKIPEAGATMWQEVFADQVFVASKGR